MTDLQRPGMLPAAHTAALAAICLSRWLRNGPVIDMAPPERALFDALVQQAVADACVRGLGEWTAGPPTWVPSPTENETELVDRCCEQVALASWALTVRLGEEVGRVSYLWDTILRLGRRRFGPPTARHEAAVVAVADLASLQALSERVLDVASWDELIANP